MNHLPMDYTRCLNATCPKRWRCARWMDDPEGIVSLAHFKYHDEHECDEFIEWEIEEDD